MSQVSGPAKDGVAEHHAQPKEGLRQLHLRKEAILVAAWGRIKVGGEGMREHALVVDVPVRAGHWRRREIEVLRGDSGLS